MTKNRKYFVCTGCGADFTKWSGKCMSCGEWNTLVEAEAPSGKKKKSELTVFPLSSVSRENLTRETLSMTEFNIVCGGGIVPGSVILLGGEPGIGKSTLSIQIAAELKALYISGEESPVQVRERAERLGLDASRIQISTNNEVGEIIEIARKVKAGLVIVDSIQTVYSSDIPGIMGSVSQVRESASRLVDYAKKNNVSVILVGHITKDGSIAGPKLLEHIVDVVLYFEGDFSRDFRVLRAFKNRYGSVNEIGLFCMTASGLEEVREKNRIFLNPFKSSAPGNAVSAAIEGSRTILFEVQSLVTYSSFSNPRRMADGFDLNRLILICAVLEKHVGMQLNTFDVFINVSGGFNINETAADLSVAMAISSSLKDSSIDEGTGFMAEVSLSGELRPVSQVEKRVQEFRMSGFKRLIVSMGDLKKAKEAGEGIQIEGVKTISEAINSVF